MRFEGNKRGINRNDYEQFAQFLGLNQSKNDTRSRPQARQEVTPQPQPQQNDKSLAMVYPVKQSFRKLYDPEIALMNGTLFEELNKPFTRYSCGRGKEGCL